MPDAALAPKRTRRLPDALLALLVAVFIVVVAYPEVVFLGGSLSPVGLNDVVDAHRSATAATTQVYPNLFAQTTANGRQDIGARVWQLVPATKFVHRTLADHQSIDWNPYSAAGSLGPETVADLKLSPFVLAVALLGASATAFTFTVLAFVVLALYCLQRLFVRTLGLGRVAAVAACVVFLFTGFGAADVNSAVGAPFVLFPVVLYTLVEYRRTGSMPRLLAAVAAYSAFILTTFIPVQLLMLVLVHALAITIDASRARTADRESLLRRGLGLVRRQLLVPGAAIGLTAFAWLPVADAVRHAGGDITSYGDRVTAAAGAARMLKILSPWVSSTHLNTGQAWAGYVGIAPLVLIAGVWSRAQPKERRLLAVCAVLGGLTLALHADIPVIRSLANAPGLRSIRRDYWAATTGGALAVATGIAVAVIGRRGADARAATVAGIAVALCAVAGFRVAPVDGVLAALVLVIALVAVMRASRVVSRRRVVALASVALVAVELFSYQNHVRVTRFDVEKPAPAYVAYIRSHIGPYRVLDAGRGALYPEWGAALGIPQVETLNIMQIPDYRQFFQHFVNPAENRLFLEIGRDETTPFLSQPLALDLLSVRYLVVDKHMTRFDAGVRAHYPLAFDDKSAGVRVYRNPGAYPNAYLSPSLRYQRTGLSSQRATQTFDTTFLAAARAAGIPGDAPANRHLGSARITDQTNTRVRITVDATKPAVLVLTDSYYRNWHVTVNGRSARLGRVDAVVRGVVVPRGRSTITFQYRSRARSVGVLVSYATLVALLIGAAVVDLRRRRARAA